MNWVDRLLLLIEVLMLWKMLNLDKANSQAIQRFLRERELWYQRRAKAKVSVQGGPTNPESPETQKAQDLNPEPLSETVELLKETENEQATESDGF